MIVVTIPQKSITDLPKNIFKDLPEDVVVIDTGNYYPTLRDGIIPALIQSGIDSLWVQEQLGVPVVKVFTSIVVESLEALGQPKGAKNRIALAVSGDNDAAKEVVFTLVNDVGLIPSMWVPSPNHGSSSQVPPFIAGILTWKN
ncbi:putative dinucleotide-binding enzyme [Chitinophaga sp. W3I9]|uniref:NADPH-dependent F420 reductase n=1 Tax=Chitinophaga sp. W3I9 TaxID=3373924 RepID=UPI003D245947